jgi:hypothetical protein
MNLSALAESSRNITFNTHAAGMLENKFFLGGDKLEVQTKKFRVSDNHGNPLFFADRDSVEIVSSDSLVLVIIIKRLTNHFEESWLAEDRRRRRCDRPRLNSNKSA